MQDKCGGEVGWKCWKEKCPCSREPFPAAQPVRVAVSNKTSCRAGSGSGMGRQSLTRFPAQLGALAGLLPEA